MAFSLTGCTRGMGGGAHVACFKVLASYAKRGQSATSSGSRHVLVLHTACSTNWTSQWRRGTLWSRIGSLTTCRRRKSMPGTRGAPESCTTFLCFRGEARHHNRSATMPRGHAGQDRAERKPWATPQDSGCEITIAHNILAECLGGENL